MHKDNGNITKYPYEIGRRFDGECKYNIIPKFKNLICTTHKSDRREMKVYNVLYTFDTTHNDQKRSRGIRRESRVYKLKWSKKQT